MVAYSDVVRRHAGYAAALFAVVTLAQFTICLAVVLSAILAGVRWDMNTPVAFSLLVGAGGPLAAALCVQLSHDTWSVRRSNVPRHPPPARALPATHSGGAHSGGTPMGLAGSAFRYGCARSTACSHTG